MEEKYNYNVGIYCRLSKDDDTEGESSSILTQRAMLTDYCIECGYRIFDTYVDDGYSGLNFQRPDFTRLLHDIEGGCIDMVVTKDLSRLGRDYIMTGYYTEIYFPAKNVRYVALGDSFDSLKEDNDIAPFKNILNDMYAKDISRKIKNAKHQHAKDGKIVGTRMPYGYRRSESDRNRLGPDPETAKVVRLIYDLALEGLGSVLIAQELDRKRILTPGAYKFSTGEIHTLPKPNSEQYKWGSAAVINILNDRVYIGDLICLKTESTNYKTKKRVKVPPERQIVTRNCHEAIVSEAEFLRVKELMSQRRCPAKLYRENLFRGLLYCSECGHPLSIAHRKLKYREEDLYRCMHHHYHPEVCTQTHSIYHNMLYDYVLEQLLEIARTMKRKKINSPIINFANVKELTPEVLNVVIKRIEIDHVTSKSKPGKVIKIYWKLE